MKITINFKEKKNYIIDHMLFKIGNVALFVTGANTVIDSGSTVLERIQANHKDVEYIDHLQYMTLASLQVEVDSVPYQWVEIESIVVKEEGRKPYEICKSHFGKFCTREIRIDGFYCKLNEADYQLIAKYVRMEDKKDNAINALENDDSLDENIFKYLSEEVIEDFAEDFDAVTDYTGEDEWNQINSYINNKCGGTVYPVFVSNKDTEDEIRQVVPLLRTQYEKIYECMREYWNGDPGPEEWGGTWPTYKDEDGNTVSLEFVDEIVLED